MEALDTSQKPITHACMAFQKRSRILIKRHEGFETNETVGRMMALGEEWGKSLSRISLALLIAPSF
jgi:hypothetical protein